MNRIRLGTIPSYVLLLLGFAASLGAILAWLKTDAQLLILFGIVGLAIFLPVVLFIAYYYRFFFLIFTLLFFALFDFFGYQSIVNVGFRIYLADGIILLLLSLVFYIRMKNISVNCFSSPITKLLLANLGYGIIAFMIGYAAGNNLRDVIGDFRRLFLYPLAAFTAFGYVFPKSNVQQLISKLAKSLLLALLVIVVVAFGRALTGKTWMPNTAYSSDPRAIGNFTGLIILMGIGVLYGYAITTTRRNRIIAYLGICPLIVVAFLSGFRLLWFGAIFVPLFVTVFTFPLKDNFLRIVFRFLLVIIGLALSIVAIKFLFPDFYQLIAEKFVERVIGFDFSEDLRYYAWRHAWEEFRVSPVVGVGIGDQFEFYAISSQNWWYISTATTHNILLNILYQAGLIGALLFILIQTRVILSFSRYIPKVELFMRGPLLGVFGAYLVALAMAMVEPLLESPGPIVGFYIIVGLLLKFSESFAETATSSVNFSNTTSS